MPRQARKHAESGIYHVMFRGIDRQLIFEEKQDYLFLLKIIQECKETGKTGKTGDGSVS